jgi:anti-anti-sigma factor
MTLSTIKLSGDVDFSRKAEIENLLAKANSVDVAVIDCSDTSYLDSSGLSCLAALKKHMHENGTAAVVRIAGANNSLRRIFEICGLDKTFELYDSLAEAQAGKLPQAS